MATRLLPVLLLALFIHSSWPQQLQGPAMGMPYNVSASCMQALNTSVACPGALAEVAANGGIVDSDGLSYLCETDCLSTLQSARSTIAQACTVSTDIVVFNEIAYPATFFADNYIYTYNLACRKDSTTGQYCDPQIAEWQTQGYLSLNQSCSDCWLGTQQLQLSNPLGYDPGLASNFASLTSACNATNYVYATPTAYALNASAALNPATASATATPPPGCTGSYTVQLTDTCESVSQELNVSTYSLLYENNLDLYCRNFNASVGTDLCSPATCTTYTWQASDTCASMALAHPPITVPQFLAWNPNFNSLCQNGGSFLGYQVCVSPPGGLLDTSSSSNSSDATAATVAVPAPTNAMTGSNRDCGDWYTIISGDTCGLVSVANYLSLSDFYFLNPEINANCSNLDLGIAYCVEPVGDIRTYAGYTTTSGAPTITVAPVSFASVNTAITTPTPQSGFHYSPSYLPKAPGTLSDCSAYHNYNASRENDCSYIAFLSDITTDQLIEWNPSLSSNLSSCSLQSGYSYCTAQNNGTTVDATNDCTPINATEIISGTSSHCDCFLQLAGYESGGDFRSLIQGPIEYMCEDIESDYSVTASQLTAWNTWLGSDCDTNLYANLLVNETRPVCVGVNASEAIGSASPGPSTQPSQTVSTGGTVTASIGPTASGEVAGCKQFYTVESGDSCTKIETTYGISFTQFYAWNPSIGNNCENLWLGYAYCVQGPISSGSASPTAPAASAPTQSGIAANCDAYYTVAGGDSCAKIETQYNDTFAELYSWNPAIGNNCQNLWVGYAICVGVS